MRMVMRSRDRVLPCSVSGGRTSMTKRLPVWIALCTFVLAANALSKLEARAGQDPNGYRLTWDDFRNGFDATSPAAKWFYFAAGPFVGDDGIATTSRNGLVVVPTGINAATGEPAFTKTLGQEDDNGGLPGGLDHVKWLVFFTHLPYPRVSGGACAPKHT